MFMVFSDQACTANVYTHEFNIACMHDAERLLFREILICKNLSNGQSVKVYTLEIRFIIDTTLICVLSTGIMCSALPNVTNGTIDYPSGTTASYDYETIVRYQCNLGHVLTNGNRARTCSGDGSSPSGQWDGTAPQCPRMFILYWSCHMTMYTHSCGLWDSSVYYQWISWDTNNHNIHRDSDLQL